MTACRRYGTIGQHGRGAVNKLDRHIHRRYAEITSAHGYQNTGMPSQLSGETARNMFSSGPLDMEGICKVQEYEGRMLLQMSP